MLSAAFALSIATPRSIEPIVVDGTLCHPYRLMAKLAPGVSPDTLQLSTSKVIGFVPEIRWATIEVPSGDLQSVRSALAIRKGVERVCLDRAAKLAYTPNDPRWPDQWSVTALKADLAWDTSLGGDSGIVAIIDTGVNVAHEDLAANMWVNTDEIPGNSIDDDLNGYVDDVNGYDFAYLDPITNDVNGHGTACAGIAAAVGDNNLGLSGVAPRGRIMAIKASLDSGYFYDSFTAPAYVYAANNGARVFSCSFFSDRVSPVERDGLEYAWSQNVLPIVAAGNSSSVIPYYPACHDVVMSVAAYQNNGNKAGFSNFGAVIDVAAGGTGLTATTASGGYTTGFGGTSGATPHVAGLAALLIGARPSATNAELRAAIEDTATAVNQSPFGEYCNYGKANAQAAMAALLGTPAPPRSPVVRYVSGLGNQNDHVFYPAGTEFASRVYGRGFQSPNVVAVTIGGLPVTVTSQTRDYIDFTYKPPVTGPFRVHVNGNLVSEFYMPDTKRVCFPMSEASTPSASTFGGFTNTLRTDGVTLRATRQNNGDIFLQTTFHKVSFGTQLKLKIRRRFTAIGAATLEKIAIYDWNSASYPYGSFVELSSAAPPTTMATSVLTIPVPANVTDDEKTVYVSITANGLPSGAELLIDELQLFSDK